MALPPGARVLEVLVRLYQATHDAEMLRALDSDAALADGDRNIIISQYEADRLEQLNRPFIDTIFVILLRFHPHSCRGGFMNLAGFSRDMLSLR